MDGAFGDLTPNPSPTRPIPPERGTRFSYDKRIIRENKTPLSGGHVAGSERGRG